MTTLASRSVQEQSFYLDTSSFLVPAQLTEQDKVSLLCIVRALHDANSPYVYLEIGSHLGGSLQPYLYDSLCTRIYSIDKRPPSQPDARGRLCHYPDNSTARMLQLLRDHHSVSLDKLTCLDGSTADIDPGTVSERPSFCFIDAEHTDVAVYRDFCFCLGILNGKGLIGFHDAPVVAPGLFRCCSHLESAGIPHRLVFLPSSIAVLAVNELGWLDHPSISKQAALGGESILYSLAELAHYRTKWNRLQTHPFVRFAAWITRPLRKRL